MLNLIACWPKQPNEKWIKGKWRRKRRKSRRSGFRRKQSVVNLLIYNRVSVSDGLCGSMLTPRTAQTHTLSSQMSIHHVSILIKRVKIRLDYVVSPGSSSTNRERKKTASNTIKRSLLLTWVRFALWIKSMNYVCDCICCACVWSQLFSDTMSLVKWEWEFYAGFIDKKDSTKRKNEHEKCGAKLEPLSMRNV